MYTALTHGGRTQPSACSRYLPWLCRHSVVTPAPLSELPCQQVTVMLWVGVTDMALCAASLPSAGLHLLGGEYTTHWLVACRCLRANPDCCFVVHIQ